MIVAQMDKEWICPKKRFFYRFMFFSKWKKEEERMFWERTLERKEKFWGILCTVDSAHLLFFFLSCFLFLTMGEPHTMKEKKVKQLYYPKGTKLRYHPKFSTNVYYYKAGFGLALSVLLDWANILFQYQEHRTWLVTQNFVIRVHNCRIDIVM